MKKLALCLTLSLLGLNAFGQGKISFQQDSLHLVYYSDIEGQPGLTGQAVDSAHMPNGVTLVADLYVGTSSSLLSFVSSATFSAVPGKWNSLSVQVPGIPGGTPVFVVTQIRDQAYAPPPLFSGSHTAEVWGFSQEFTFTLGSGITYPVMWGANGTWPAGTYPLDQYGVGDRGAIGLFYIPEPATIGLTALGGVFAMTLGRCKARKLR